MSARYGQVPQLVPISDAGRHTVSSANVSMRWFAGAMASQIWQYRHAPAGPSDRWWRTWPALPRTSLR